MLQSHTMSPSHLSRFLLSLPLILSLVPPAVAQDVPEAELEALYGAAYPGVGVRLSAIVPGSSCTTGQVPVFDATGSIFACGTVASGGGLSTVETDGTLDGDGSSGDPLGVADDGIDNAQLADNSVREPEIQANARCYSEMEKRHGVFELRERICPDPSGGTSGQVCARNTAGTAYELVTPSGGAAAEPNRWWRSNAS